ncbi:MAG: type III polyketide synthase [Planctomycetota bacterium]
MSATIVGIGLATPGQTIAQDRVAELIARASGANGTRARAISTLYRNSGVRSRGIASAAFHEGDLAIAQAEGTAERMRRYHELAPPIAAHACTTALGRAGVRPDGVTHLITVSCTGLASPGLDIELIHRLELPASTERVNVGFMGCHGALNGLRVARALAASSEHAVVLLCCAELCSLHFQGGQPEGSAVADALFADGAAACVVRRGGDGPAIAHSEAVLLPDSLSEMAWDVGPSGFLMTLSPRVPDLLSRHVPGWVDGLLSARGMARGDIASWAIHPGGPRVLQRVAGALGLDPSATEASADVLGQHGNMSSATILFIIDRMLRAGARLPLLAMAFGPGLTGEAVLLADDAR